jgi:lactate dehydrogenase-like 2-hydroxyacid dehydrogenase
MIAEFALIPLAYLQFIDKLGPHCTIIANLGTGYDHIDTVHAASKGVWVSNTPNVVAAATADLTLAHLVCLLCARPVSCVVECLASLLRK